MAVQVKNETHSDSIPMEGVNFQDSDDDPVVRELDVYLSPEFSGQMYLLQYPLVLQHHPDTRINNDDDDDDDDWLQQPPLRARIKSRHNLFTEDHAIPTHAVGGGHGGYAGMPQRTFESQTIPIDTHLCIGKIGKSETDDHAPIIHLVPLTHIYHMRPSFRHVDDTDHQGSPHNFHATDMMNEDHPNEAEEDAEEDYHPGAAAALAKKSPVLFQRKESERAVLARQSSYAFKKSSEDAEPWQDLEVIHAAGNDDGEPVMSDTTVSWNQRAILKAVPESIWASSSSSSDQTKLNASGNSYIQSLNYYHDQHPKHHPLVSTGRDQKVVSIPTMNHYEDDLQQWVSRLSSMLQSGCPIPYSILKWQLLQNVPATTMTDSRPDTLLPDDVLFLALSSCAVLCRGNWCLHSRFVFPTSTPHNKQASNLSSSSSSSSFSGAGGLLLLQRLRTLILLVFQDHGIVYRPPLSRVVRYMVQPRQPFPLGTATTPHDESILSPDQIAFVLSNVAKPHPSQTPNNNNNNNNTGGGGGGGWVLKVEDDVSFLKLYPSVVQQHAEYWNRQRRRFRTELEIYQDFCGCASGRIEDEFMNE
jgi:hypothetical protein